MAGVSRLQYRNEIRLIRVMCSGRVDLGFILRAFANGQDGVFIGGCRLNECNYVTQGNYDAYANTMLAKRILAQIGLDPDRLGVAFMNASDGIFLAKSVDEFSDKIEELGPIGQGEGLDPKALEFDLAAVRRLVPYLRLVERERLRVPVKSEKSFREFFTSEEFEALFKALFVDKLAISRITMLLREKPLSTTELAAALGLNPSEVSRHINTSSQQGLVRYDVETRSYALA